MSDVESPLYFVISDQSVKIKICACTSYILLIYQSEKNSFLLMNDADTNHKAI